MKSFESTSLFTAPARKSLIDKYRPDRLSDLVGQADAVAILSAFVSRPYPSAFLFHGATGVGKSAAALALANELGCDIDQPEFGGVWQIQSGEQSVANVRDLLARLAYTTMYGSGWKVCIVNECDNMHPQVEAVWLDALEGLRSHIVVVFTTNNASKLSDRFRDRCQEIAFKSAEKLANGNIDPAMQEAVAALVRRICLAETGRPDIVKPEDLKNIVRDGAISFRRAVQELAKTQPLISSRLAG